MSLKVDFDQLHTAVEWSIKQLATPKKNRIDAIKQFVGTHYGDDGSSRNVPTNFLELAITIYIRQLAARSPRVMISTSNRALKPMAKNMSIALNQLPDEIGLGETIQGSVLEAMFTFGVVKVGIASSGVTVLGQQYGEPYADLVSIDDYFCDMSAKSRKTMQYEGNDYWLPIEDAQELFGAEMDGVQHDDHSITGPNGEDRAEGVTVPGGADLYKKKVWLRDVYLRQTNQLVTYAVTSKRLLRVVEFDGPDVGPYHVLGFSDVPGNLLPLPPVALWIDLHNLGNTLFRKLGRQADAKKTVASFQGGNDEDIESLKRASDGDGIRYSGQKPEAITVGGIDQASLAFYLQVRDLFSYFSGNIDALGGLSPSTETVGQDKLLTEAAGARLQTMKDRTIDFARGIFKALAWYEWTDPIRERLIEKDVPGAGVSVKRVWSKETRDGDFLDYNINIDVYSMQDDSPSLKLQKIGMMLERFIFPAIPLLQAQGGTIDFKRLLDLLSSFGNLPELADIIRFEDFDPAVKPIQGNQNPVMMPANTTRTYERINRPGATRQGKDHVMSQLLMGGKVQPDAMASLSRRVG